MREVDLAWCAGFFDGEGHVSYRRGYPSPKTGIVSPKLLASIPQKDDNREVLDKFKSIIGFGKINERTYRKTTNNTITDMFILRYGKKTVGPLFKLLQPNLGTKKTTDFIRAIIGYEHHNSRPTKEDWTRLITHNKKKGCTQCKSEWNGLVCSECGYMW